MNIHFDSLPPVVVPVSTMPAKCVVVNAMHTIINVDAELPDKSTTSYVIPSVSTSFPEPSVVLNVVPTFNVSHAQLVAYFSMLVKLSSKCNEIALNYQDFKTKFDALNEKYTVLLGRVDILMSILGSVMGRVSTLENHLLQPVQIQIDLNTTSTQAAQNMINEYIDT